LLFVGYIQGEGGSLTSGGCDLRDKFFELALIAGSYGHGGACFREFQRASVADALRSAGYQRHASGESHSRISS
jgi:hypothetical protein